LPAKRISDALPSRGASLHAEGIGGASEKSEALNGGPYFQVVEGDYYRDDSYLKDVELSQSQEDAPDEEAWS
jgi:hypothetical protein